MNLPISLISVSGRSLNSYGTREFLGYPPLNLLGDLGDVIVIYCFYCLQAFLLKLPLISSCFLVLPYFLKGKSCQWSRLNLSFIVLVKVSSQSEAGNIIVYTLDQGTNREKNFNHIIYQMEKMSTLAGNKHLSVHFFPHGPRPFHLWTVKSTVRSVGNGHQSSYSRADTINKNLNKSQRFFHTGNKYYKTLDKII